MAIRLRAALMYVVAAGPFASEELARRPVAISSAAPALAAIEQNQLLVGFAQGRSSGQA